MAVAPLVAAVSRLRPAHHDSALTREREEGSEKPDLWATWSCWWGSPELVAQVARKALHVIAAAGPQSEMDCAITLTVGDDCERFRSPNAFVLGASPEALRRFTWLELLVYGNGLALRVSFDRRGRGRLGGGGDQVVHLEVWPAEDSRQSDAVDVARNVAVSLRRGYARYWAGCASAPQLRKQAGRPLPAHRFLGTLVLVGVGALLGAGVARLFDDIPGIVLSPQAAIAVLAGIGMGYPALISQLIPNVEVATAGRTLLISVALKSAIAVAGLAGTQLLQLIVG